jgi:8-oxo-dGTP pyrophosphatase MutT (NUDIX family)
MIDLKAKPPAFLLCDNPMTAAADDRQFILHNRNPKLLAEVRHFRDVNDFDIENTKAKIPWCEVLKYSPDTIFFTIVWVDNSDQDMPDKIPGTLKRMADWYKSYLIWEDSQ